MSSKDEDDLSEEWLQHVIRQGLECWRRIGEAKQHDQELKESLVRPKCRLLNVVQVHQHLVVAGAQVKLGEEFGATHLVQEFLEDGELVLDGLFVECMEVDT
jgi:hypothetical protein